MREGGGGEVDAVENGSAGEGEHWGGRSGEHWRAVGWVGVCNLRQQNKNSWKRVIEGGGKKRGLGLPK